jgi:hypothetical protein
LITSHPVEIQSSKQGPASFYVPLSLSLIFVPL